MRNAHRLLPLLVLGALITGCVSPRASELNTLESERSVATARVAALEATVAASTARLEDYRDRIRRHESATMAYMLNHKLAVAAVVAGVGGAEVALDPDNAFTSDAQVVGGVVALLAAAWAVGNMPEVLEVADALAQADSHYKQLQAAASDVERRWQAQNADLLSARGQLEGVNARIAQLRAAV
jgi:peptidoglycan hydrolase CwlO-like protein